MITSSTHRLEAPVFLIKLRVWFEVKKLYIRKMKVATVARPDKRKSVKGFIWINPADVPIKNGSVKITCFKTGCSFYLHPALITKFKK